MQRNPSYVETRPSHPFVPHPILGLSINRMRRAVRVTSNCLGDCACYKRSRWGISVTGAADEFSRQRRQSVAVTLGEQEFGRDILTVDVPLLVHRICGTVIKTSKKRPGGRFLGGNHD